MKIFGGNDVVDYFTRDIPKDNEFWNDGVTSVLKQLMSNKINMLILYLVM